MSFTTIERKIGSALSGLPFLKGFLKKLYFHIINFGFNNNKTLLKLNNNIKILSPFEWANIDDNDTRENMFGYFDITPWSKNSDYYINNYFINKKTLEVVIFDRKLSEKRTIAYSKAINLQHCALAQWTGLDQLIINNIENNKVISEIYDIKGRLIRKFNYPVQTVSNNYNYFSSIDYSYLDSIGSDYGYKLKRINKRNELNYEPSLHIICLSKGSIRKSINCKELYLLCRLNKERIRNQEINHAKFSKDDKYLSFIFRWCERTKRKSKLILLDIESNTITQINDFDVVSHYCWLDNHSLLVWGMKDEVGKYFHIDICKNFCEENPNTNINTLGDGHPTLLHEYNVICDTYPDRRRTQLLYILDYKNWTKRKLLKLYSPLKFINKKRVDLHPRISPCMKYISIDTSYKWQEKESYFRI